MEDDDEDVFEEPYDSEEDKNFEPYEVRVSQSCQELDMESRPK
jgi:hypothetical protein